MWFLRKCFVILVIFMEFEKIFGARDPPLVMIPNQGMLMGVYLKMFRIQRIIGYLGIPYAQPPINDKRFQPPVVDNLPRWDGIRNASTIAPDCWQKPRKSVNGAEDDAFVKLTSAMQGSTLSNMTEDQRQYDEDCLYLNIYIPDGPPPTDGYAVIAWLHSGDFMTGSPHDLDPFQLVFKQKVIVVTIGFRLSIFGFFTSMDGESPGNFGLMDQSAALFWVKTNIKFFGGNERAITLMGHGAGAISISLHLTSGEWSEDMFNRTIIMSGVSVDDLNVKPASAYAKAVKQTADAFGCFRRPTSGMMQCLRRLTPTMILDGTPTLDWGPIIDDGLSNTTMPFITDFPSQLIKTKLRKTPMMIGFTDMENVMEGQMLEIMNDGFSKEIYDTMLSDIVLADVNKMAMNGTNCNDNSNIVLEAVEFVYKPMSIERSELRKRYIDFHVEREFAAPSLKLATEMSKQSVNTFVYRFDMKLQTNLTNDMLPSWIGVPHRFDLIYVWGMPFWLMINNTKWDDADKRISDIIMTMWANFAKYENPTETGIYIKWDNFTVDTQGVLIIDRSFNMSDSTKINYQAINFWNDFYPKIVSFASQCCNTSEYSSAARISLSNFYQQLLLLITIQLSILIYQLPT